MLSRTLQRSPAGQRSFPCGGETMSGAVMLPFASTVTRLSVKEVRERVELRAILEVKAALESRTRMGEPEFAELERRLAALDRAVAQGMSPFVASGDNGAYTCGEDQGPAGSFPATLPTVTAVGGTTVFESEQGVYFKEMAWGGPIEGSGSGGGPSRFYALPTYQKSVSQTLGHGLRQVPDVSADADPATGFHIVFQGKDGQAFTGIAYIAEGLE